MVKKEFKKTFCVVRHWILNQAGAKAKHGRVSKLDFWLIAIQWISKITAILHISSDYLCKQWTMCLCHPLQSDRVCISRNIIFISLLKFSFWTFHFGKYQCFLLSPVEFIRKIFVAYCVDLCRATINSLKSDQLRRRLKIIIIYLNVNVLGFKCSIYWWTVLNCPSLSFASSYSYI